MVDSDSGDGRPAGTDAVELLMRHYQHGMPISERPYADMGAALGLGEAEVIDTLERLRADGVLSRVGPVFASGRVGASTLAALCVPDERLEDVAALVNGCQAVNHNYQREHRLNLWFVVTAADGEALQAVLDDIARRTGLEVLDLPLVRPFHIDLGFALS